LRSSTCPLMSSLTTFGQPSWFSFTESSGMITCDVLFVWKNKWTYTSRSWVQVFESYRQLLCWFWSVRGRINQRFEIRTVHYCTALVYRIAHLLLFSIATCELYHLHCKLWFEHCLQRFFQKATLMSQFGNSSDRHLDSR
jgi:hypothetical protein